MQSDLQREKDEPADDGYAPTVEGPFDLELEDVLSETGKCYWKLEHNEAMIPDTYPVFVLVIFVTELR